MFFKLTPNGFQACGVQLEAVFCRNAFNKATCFLDICKAKINSAVSGQKPLKKLLMSDTLAQIVCYAKK